MAFEKSFADILSSNTESLSTSPDAPKAILKNHIMIDDDNKFLFQMYY